MPIKVEPHRTIENAETVREARDIAWIGCLLIVLSPTAYVFFAIFAEGTLNLTQAVVFLVLPALVLVRLIFIAHSLGRNLVDHMFLAEMETWNKPYFYLLKRFFGF